MRLEGVAGRAFEPVEFVLADRLSVQNWARAIGTDEAPFLHARSARGGARPVPPVLYAFFLTLSDEALVNDLGFVWGRTLAAGITAEVGRVADDSEWLRGQSFADLAYEKVGRDGVTRQFLRLRTDFHDERGQLVNRWQTLFIEKREGPVTVPPPEEAPDDQAAPFSGVVRSSAPAVPVDGQLAPHRIGPLTRLDFARMSVALDDPNLVHLDESVAAAAGFGGVIGSGGYVLSLVYEVARRWVGTDRVCRVEMRQLAPFPQGTLLCATGAVVDTCVDGDPSLGKVEAVVTDGADTTIGTGTVTVRL